MAIGINLPEVQRTVDKSLMEIRRFQEAKRPEAAGVVASSPNNSNGDNNNESGYGKSFSNESSNQSNKKDGPDQSKGGQNVRVATDRETTTMTTTMMMKTIVTAVIVLMLILLSLNQPIQIRTKLMSVSINCLKIRLISLNGVQWTNGRRPKRIFAFQ